MSLFSSFKKDNSPRAASEQSQADPGTAKRLMEELYKRNAELAVRNKTLTLLRKLDEISLKTLEAEEMGGEMCSAISEELGYDLVALSIVGRPTNDFRWLSIASSTPWIADAIKTINLSETEVPVSNNKEILEKISSEVGYLVSNPKELYPGKLVDAITEVAGFYKIEPTKNSLVHQLNFGSQSLGVLILSSNRDLKDASNYERESITGIVGLISLAIYKAQIYKELQDLTHNLQQKVDEQTKEVKQAYEVEKKARIELEDLNKAKDQFVLATQHHLRTPLTIVRGYMESLYKDVSDGNVDNMTLESIKKASLAADRLNHLVNELLSISQMETGAAVLRKTPTDINAVIQSVLGEIKEEIEKNKVQININLPKDVKGRTLNVDADKMKEALWNILDNAVKYNKANGSVSVTGEEVSHPIERDKKVFRLIIDDTGMGITKEELPKLFFMYFERGKIAEEINATGRGIGLVVTKNIINAHGGRIWAESEGDGKGSRFVIELPIS